MLTVRNRLIATALLLCCNIAYASGQAATALKPNSGILGTVASISKDSVTINSSVGLVRAKFGTGLTFYKRIPSSLSQVTDRSFIGVSSVMQPDGSEKATEIHIFPESLRGAGEGSSMIGQPTAGTNQSRMTNGTVSGSRMTNGTVSGSRMTNGTVQRKDGASTIAVVHDGKAQTVIVPSDVKVTAIAPTQDRPAVGDSLFFVPEKKSDGSYTTSKITLTTPAPAK